MQKTILNCGRRYPTSLETLPTNCQNQQKRESSSAANVHPLVFVVLCAPSSYFFFLCVLTVQLYSSTCFCPISVSAKHHLLQSLHKYTTVFSVVSSAHTKTSHNAHLKKNCIVSFSMWTGHIHIDIVRLEVGLFYPRGSRGRDDSPPQTKP